MKREEAIKILQPIGEQYCEIANITLATRMDEIAEAIDMAIEALNAQLSQEGTTSDLISRQAAIDAIHNLYAIHGSEGSWIDQKDAFKALNSLPPAQPKVIIGHWIQYDKRFPWRHHYKCSVCGNYLDFSGVNGGRGEVNFCPNCGAKMKGERQK